MAQWEYLFLKFSSTTEPAEFFDVDTGEFMDLNWYGEKGWEVVSYAQVMDNAEIVETATVFLKREKT